PKISDCSSVAAITGIRALNAFCKNPRKKTSSAIGTKVNEITRIASVSHGRVVSAIRSIVSGVSDTPGQNRASNTSANTYKANRLNTTPPAMPNSTKQRLNGGIENLTRGLRVSTGNNAWNDSGNAIKKITHAHNGSDSIQASGTYGDNRKTSR